MKLRRRDTGDVFPCTGEVTIGRLPKCGIVVSDESVSREHARLTESAGEWTVKDLGSSNGTKRNGRDIQETVLYGGDLLTIGAIAFDVLLEGAKPEVVRSPPKEADALTGSESAAEASRRRMQRAARESERGQGVGDLGQLPVATQLLIAIFGIAFVAGVAYLVRWLAGA